MWQKGRRVAWGHVGSHGGHVGLAGRLWQCPLSEIMRNCIGPHGAQQQCLSSVAKGDSQEDVNKCAAAKKRD